MQEMPIDFMQLQWVVDIVQNIDAGIIVVNKEGEIHMWNGFMTHQTGKQASEVLHRSLYEVFPEIDREWFDAKARPVFSLGCRSFITWQQRPYLFRCRNVRPITQQAEHMYQNVTLAPIKGTTGKIEHMSLFIQDVTNEAIGI
uniref:PAS domain-containing protein n=1 Tax=Thaumasiovibrio occultus TaxID=1891184 RepID=UPI000B35F5F5|nr:PAS domain-containing protein [Thaumasiovibrio occultus]